MRVLLTTFYDARCTGLRILASCLAQKNYDVHVCLIKEHINKIVKNFPEDHRAYQMIDSSGYMISMCDANPISEKEEYTYISYIKQLKPDVIGFSLRSYLNDLTISLIKKIKSIFPDIAIICGGFGPTLEPQRFAPYVDAVIRGEGEEAILDVCDALRRKDSVTSIANVSCMKDGHYIENELRSPCVNISRYPLPFSFHDGNERFVLIENDSLTRGDPLKEWQAYCFLLGRGCLGTCSYCSGGQWTTLYHDAGYKIPKRRLKDIDDAIAELIRAKNDGYKRIHFTDEYLAASASYINEFLDKYEKHINLPVEMYLHYLFTINHPEILHRLAKLGLKKVCLGIQCGDEKFSKEVYNRHTTHNDLLKFSNMVKEQGISLQVHLIIGNPLEDEMTFRNSLKFLAEIPFEPGIDTLTCFRFTPFPHSPIVERFGKQVIDPVPQLHFERQGCLAQLRMLLKNDDDFLPLLDNPLYFEHPELLQERYYKLMNISL